MADLPEARVSGPDAAAPVSPLTYLGEEVHRIFVPVSATMALCVCLVRALMPNGSDNPNAVSIAQVWYEEDEHKDASNAEKFEGGAMNALIFVLFITVMTFVLFLLFKYRCTTVIWAYMGFAGFNVFFVLFGVLGVCVRPCPAFGGSKM